MYDRMIATLLENLSNSDKYKWHMDLNLILDGGAFSGSYQLGALYYLREMEKRYDIQVDKISGCSIGAILGYLYITDQLDYGVQMYKHLRQCFIEKGDLSIAKSLLEQIQKNSNDDVYLSCNGRLVISYYDVLLCEHIGVDEFENNDHLFDVLYRSIFIPIFIDGRIVYNERYIDGLYPKINIYSEDIREKPVKLERKRKTLFLNLMNGKFQKMIYIKGELNNATRILTGILDIHSFFLDGTKTEFCSYLEEWNDFDNSVFYLRKVLSKIFVYFISCYLIMKKHFRNISSSYEQNSNLQNGILPYFVRFFFT